MKNFSIYFLIGIFNTVIHWSVFGTLYFFEVKQYLCNFIGFSCAVTFSYLANVKFNFKSEKSAKSFGLFFCLMGVLNLGVGGLADKLNMFPLFTLFTTSILSLFSGYILSKYLLFKVIK